MTDAAAVWMLRINPMARCRLADTQLADLLGELFELEATTESLARAAGDDLYRLVPQAGSEAIRRRLLALRRAIHNDRDQPDAADVPAELPASVERWADHRDRRSRCRSEIGRIYDDALTRERSMLRRRLGEGHFLTTLAQSAAGVYADACRYASRRDADAGDRKAERALVQYLTRAMMRTSPYGRFTAVGLAQPSPSGVAMDRATPATATAHVEVDRALFEYVMGGLAATGREEVDPVVSLPPTARVAEDRVTFFQVGPDAMRRLSAPLTGHTALLVDLLALGPRRRSALADAVADRLGTNISAAERLLRNALSLGLLVSAWRGDEFVAEPVKQAAQDLSSGAAVEVLEGLRQFQADLDRLAGRDSEDSSRGARRETAVRQRLATGGDALSRLAGRPAKLAVHEDFILDPLLVDPAGHEPALDDLAAVTGFLATFDRTHVVRALAAAAVVERFGAGCRISLVDHAEAVVRMVYQAEQTMALQPDAAIGPADGSLTTLAKVRREALDALSASLAAGGGDEVHWSPGDVADLVSGLPQRFRAGPASYGMVVQPVGRDLVVNDAYAGHGPMVSRFLHADHLRGGDAGARLHSRMSALFGPDVRLVEDGGHHGMSLNAHPRVLDEALDPEGWRGLHLRHDADTDTVGLEDGYGLPVKALALGAELPELFPYPVRLATWLCSSGRIVVDIPGASHQLGSGATTVAYPRLRVGRVILSRRRWYPGTDFPARQEAGTDVDYLLALTRWRAVNRVPAEVVLKSVVDGPTQWATMSAEASRAHFFDLRRQSKPQYVDLASALMARVLPRFLERRPAGFVEEALPALAGGGHALEWMVEMARPDHGTGFAWRTWRTTAVAA